MPATIGDAAGAALLAAQAWALAVGLTWRAAHLAVSALARQLPGCLLERLAPATSLPVHGLRAAGAVGDAPLISGGGGDQRPAEEVPLPAVAVEEVEEAEEERAQVAYARLASMPLPPAAAGTPPASQPSLPAGDSCLARQLSSPEHQPLLQPAPTSSSPLAVADEAAAVAAAAAADSFAAEAGAAAAAAAGLEEDAPEVQRSASEENAERADELLAGPPGPPLTAADEAGLPGSQPPSLPVVDEPSLLAIPVEEAAAPPREPTPLPVEPAADMPSPAEMLRSPRGGVEELEGEEPLQAALLFVEVPAAPLPPLELPLPAAAPAHNVGRARGPHLSFGKPAAPFQLRGGAAAAAAAGGNPFGPPMPSQPAALPVAAESEPPAGAAGEGEMPAPADRANSTFTRELQAAAADLIAGGD